MKLTCLCK